MSLCENCISLDTCSVTKPGIESCFFFAPTEDFRIKNSKEYAIGYEQGRADGLDKIYKMMLLGCDELKCEECAYKQYSQDVCQQAYTIGMIEKYIAEQLKEQSNES